MAGADLFDITINAMARMADAEARRMRCDRDETLGKALQTIVSRTSIP